MPVTIIDVQGLLEGLPPGAWVAISEAKNSVVAFGDDIEEVARTAEESGEDLPLLVRVPRSNMQMFY